MGLTQSNFVAFKLSVPGYPWPYTEYEPSDYELWDESVSVSDLGQKNLYQWKDIYAFGMANQQDIVELTYEWDAIRTFVENNIFALTWPGLVYSWQPLSWDLNFELSEDKYFDRPNALAIKRLLMDKNNDKVRQQVFQLLISLVKDPGTKLKWKAQQTDFADMNTYAKNSDDEFLRLDYEALVGANYEAALKKSVDYYLNVISKVNHTDKVVLSKYYNWIIGRVINNVVSFLKDESAYKFYSICFRLGDDGCKQLSTYLQQAKVELNK
jgi:hypothetical protein